MRKVRHENIIADPDGSQVDYYPNWLPFKRSLALYDKLLELPFEQLSVVMPLGTVPQPRLTTWHGDPGRSYTYTGLRVDPKPWTLELQQLRNELTEFLGYPFNSVLANYYRDGNDYMGAHHDNEKGLGPTPYNCVIASVSFNGPRDFVMRSNDGGHVHRIELQCGSLLVMSGTTQQHWKHEVPKTKKSTNSRINLTYRVIIDEL